MDFGALAIPQRFWDKVVPVTESGCWIWVGSTTPEGYGQTSFNSKLILAHRVAYKAANGSLTKGLTIDHLCRVRCCVNPAHLQEVTHRVNILRGTSMSARHARKTHCIHGHPFDETNTMSPRNGWRQCRACARINRNKRRLGFCQHCSKTYKHLPAHLKNMHSL